MKKSAVLTSLVALAAAASLAACSKPKEEAAAPAEKH